MLESSVGSCSDRLTSKELRQESGNRTRSWSAGEKKIINLEAVSDGEVTTIRFAEKKADWQGV